MHDALPARGWMAPTLEFRRLDRLAHWLAVAFMMTLAPAVAAQSGWKTEKPVEIVVPAAAGGGTDRMARVIQRIFQDRKLVESHSLVVNKAGGGGAVGFSFVAQRKADPHTVLVTYPSLLTNHIVGTSTLSHADFTPLAQFSNEYVGFAVRPDSPITSAADLLDRLRRNPQSVVFATFAIGSPTHVALAPIMRAAGVDVRKLKVVVYPSSGESLTALYGGHVDVVPSGAANLVAPLQASRLRVLALTSPRRLSGQLSQVPTWKESGVDAVLGYWRGLVAPSGLTPAQIGFWDDVLGQLVRTDEWKKDLERSTAESEYLPSREAKRFLDAQYEELKRILIELGLAKQV